MIANAWAELCERAPALRPEYTNAAGDTFVMVLWSDAGAWQPKPPLPPFAQLSVAPNWQVAYRDAAIVALARAGMSPMLEMINEDQWRLLVVIPGQGGATRPFLGATPDETVYRACAAAVVRGWLK